MNDKREQENKGFQEGISRKQFIKGAMSVAAMGLAGGSAHSASEASWQRGKSSDELVLTDAVVLTMDDKRRAFRSGFIWLKGSRIFRVGAMADLGVVPPNVEKRKMAGRLIMPGLINCHTHLSNGILRGIYDEMPLEVWFSKGMWPVLDALNGDTAEAAANLSLLELMSIGVTTVAASEFGTPNPDVPDGVLQAIEKSGVRAVMSRITFDGDDETAPSQFIPAPYRERPAAAVREVSRLQQRYNSPLIQVGAEALGVLRCTKDMVQAMHGLAVDTGSHFTVHAASSQEERDESLRRFGHGSIDELARLGVLGPKTLLAHVIWVDDNEIGTLSERGTGVSHNPVSNAFYASGVARLPELIQAGVRVGLGTDGSSTNNGQNVWETMKMAMLFQKQRLEKAGFGSAELALELMTRGGAEALHMLDEIGSLESGKRADLIVIDIERLALAPKQTVVSNLVYSNDPWAVQDVYIDGDAVIRNRKHRSLKASEVIARAEVSASALLRSTGLDSYLMERSSWQWQ